MFSGGRGAENKKGCKMKDSLAMLLKTNGGKMSDFSSPGMLLKTHDLFLFSRDIDEKKGC
jgi:ABC-type enterochelin transport system substrate-binding protein